MKDTGVAYRYARALFQAAHAANADRKVQAEIAKFVQLMNSDAALTQKLDHPLISLAEKQHAIRKAMGDSVSDIFERFSRLLLSRKRLPLVSLIATYFEDVYNEQNHIHKVQVHSAEPMNEKQTEELSKRLSKSWGGQVVLDTTVDKSLIGGIMIKMGDKVWDRSIREQLRKLRENLLETARN
jgi:F-type H+-transporting ATPase subunit delta